MYAPPPTAPLLHRFLGIGLLLLSAAAAAMKAAGNVPALPPSDLTATLALAFSGIAVALVGLVWLRLKPAVPERRPGQSVDDYWRAPDVLAKVMRVWFLTEGAGVFSIVGYFLTGSSLAAGAAALAVVSLWLLGPGRFGDA